ncbi:MAG TPA: SMC family ATPase [Ornithinibacter sp.]|nr:SMC family ATPase [Ornithinibacter sp.]
MRVHRLEIEAFGPFAGHVVVDVDALSAEGLFLIHGPTGSGKTSLLDAICFALYADVPGARSKNGLRSDHAPPDAVPRVTLDVTAGTRRLRIRRSPEFLRPKKRGTGWTRVQALVTLEERVDGRWVALSTRNDEVADVVKDALGMGMAQFAKVVLLPQGDFAAFLRATPEDRREVLERLFDISAFSDVESWLAEERRSAGAELERARRALSADLLRVEDVLADAGLAHGEATAESLVDAPAASVPERLRRVVEVLDARVSSTMAEFDAASGLERAAAEVLAAARSLADRRRRGARALAQLGALEAAQAQHEDRVRALAEAARAATVGGHLTAHDRAVADRAAAMEAADRTRARLAGSALAALTDDEVPGVAARLTALDETVRAIGLERAQATARARRREDLDARAERLAGRADEVAALVAEAERHREGFAAEVDVLAEEAAREPELELRLTAARDRLALLDQVEADEAAAGNLRPHRDGLRGSALDRRAELLDLRLRRIEGMAGELARGLVDGVPCPVCGGEEHPRPAHVADPVLAGDLELAEARLEAAEGELRVVERQLTELATRTETRRVALGEADRPSLEAAVEAAAALLAGSRGAVVARDEAAAHLATAVEALSARRAELVAITVDRASVAGLVAELDDEGSAAAARLEALLGQHERCPCSSDDPAEHVRLAEALVAHTASVSELAAAGSRTDAARADLEAALVTAGFADRQAAIAAVLSDVQTARWRGLVDAHVEQAAAAQAVMQDPEVVEALAAEQPDLPALEADARTTREALLAAAAAQDDAQRALRALERLLPAVDEACGAVGAAEARDARVRELADTTSGTGPDNTLRMRLTAYVLAARLEKVADLANERLAVMGGGRYVLEHSDERAARGARSGLGLRVLDQWTGRVRDTATLSGGESFMASLALALGLADAVREEAGGLDLGTLFIDEGFGSLDDDSLEQVLTVLDGLREGGRAVGVVSHVADLRARITHQAVVHKGAAGSTVEVRAGGVPSEPAA